MLCSSPFIGKTQLYPQCFLRKSNHIGLSFLTCNLLKMPRLAEDAFEWEELNAFKVLAKIWILLSSSIFLFCLAPFLLQSVRCTRCERADAPWRSQLSHNAPARCFGSASVCVWAAVFGVFSYRLFSWVFPHWWCVVAQPAPQQLLQWAYWSPTPLLQPGETLVTELLKHTCIIYLYKHVSAQ